MVPVAGWKDEALGAVEPVVEAPVAVDADVGDKVFVQRAVLTFSISVGTSLAMAQIGERSNPLCISKTEQLDSDKHGRTALVIAVLLVVQWHTVSARPQLVVAMTGWKQLSYGRMSAGDAKLGSGAL